METKQSCDFTNRNTSWNKGTTDKTQSYRQQVQGDFNTTNSFKMESTANDTKHFVDDINNSSDHTSKPPLQPSPNIVDQVAFSKTHSTCR